MVLVDKILILFMISLATYAVQIVPFIPKDRASSLLFQSSDDQVRYLSQNQNTLVLVNAASKIELLKTKSELSLFSVITTPNKKNILFEVDEQPFVNLDPLKNKTIYFSAFKEKTLTQIGNGSNARLHLDDQWASYFDAIKKILHFDYLQLLGKNHYTIALNNKISPYFTPEVSFVEHEQVLYTDINDKGEEALISYNLKTQNFTFLHKTVGAGKKISHCLLNHEIIIAEFDLGSKPSISLFGITYNGSKSFSEKKSFYNDQFKYLPKLVCNVLDNNVFMLKKSNALDKQSFKIENTLVMLYLPKQNIVELSLERPFSQIYNMDNRILLQSGGQVYQVTK